MDDSIVVVDKPAGVPSQAADPERPDDLVTRVAAHLGAPYLGVHQRLDRDTSGVLVLARSKEANPGLARQFEGRDVEKVYLAAVEGFRGRRGPTTLVDHLAKGDDGRMNVVAARHPGAQKAVTHVRVLSERSGRALLELRLETGRTHQARVQLAHAGAPIAGDTLYGGASAPRLLLHARRLAFVHPTSGARVSYEAPVPREMESWLAHGPAGAAVFDDAAALSRALRLAVERRFGLGRSEGGPRATTAFRLVNEGGDGLPGLAVDAYEGHLVAQFYEDEGTWPPERKERVLDALHALGFDGIYVKFRPKQANVIVDARRETFAPKDPARGTAAPESFTILEEGVPYGVRLADGLSTGLFLDQRENRRRVRLSAGGQRVLNLFAYTCGFTMAAAVGGASRTVSVDAAAGALERGRENLEREGLLSDAHSFVAEDVFAWLGRADRKGERFDLVILDPPSYSKTKKHRFSSESDYGDLAAQTIRLLAPGGRLLACSNHRGISHGKFRQRLRQGAEAAGRGIAQLKDLPDPSDFPPPLGGECHLKSALLTVAR